MANLTVSIVIRVNRDGKRNWVPAKGKCDPAGSYYIRYCVGSTPKYEFVGKDYHEAESARLRQERVLKAASIGAVIPEAVPDQPKLHRIADVIVVYLDEQAKPDKNGEFKSQKSINSTRSEPTKFAKACGKTYVEEIDRKVLLAFRDSLNAEGYERDTVYNKMMSVVTWLKHNGVVPYTPILKSTDWPEKKATTPDPNSDEEIAAMISHATYDEGLLVRFLVGTGMREQEASVAEREDINEAEKYIQVQRAKPQYGWRRKNKAAVRRIYLGDDLLAALLSRKPGLPFPSKSGHRHTKFLRDVTHPLAVKAGVKGTTEKPNGHPEACKNDWLHRCRDTWLSNQVDAAQDISALRSVCRQAGHSNLETLDIYAQLRTATDPRTRAAANVSDRFAAKPQLVKVG